MTYQSSISKMPFLIFDGNCQAHHLAAIFHGAGLCEAYCVGEDFGFVPAYRGTATTYCTEDEACSYVEQAKSMGRPVYQVSQSTQMQAAANMSYTPSVDSIIKFPFLQYYCIAPNAFKNVYKRLPRPQRILDFDLGLMRLCQEKAESRTDYAAFVQEEGRQSLLFNTESHPRGALMSLLFRNVATGIKELDLQDVDNVATHLKIDEGINHVTVHPTSGDILQELGFDWGPDYAVLRDTLVAAASADWQRVIVLCEGTSNTLGDSQLLMALGRAYIATGQMERKGAIYKRLTDLSPGFMHSWLLRAQYWGTVGDAAELAECRLQLRQALRHSRYYSQTRAWMDIQAGNLEQGLGFAYDYLQRTPDRADGIVPYAKILTLLGRVNEARETFYTFARNRGLGDFHNVVSQLGNLEELRVGVEDLRKAVEAA